MDYIEYDAQDGDVADVARKDCEAHWVNWRTRALEAEADVLAMLDLVEKLAVIASDHLAALRRRAIADRAARRLRPVGPPTD